MSEWKQVQAEGLAMGEGGFSGSAIGNSSETFRLKVRYIGVLYIHIS